jgi:transcriptional regulator with XRE-family HTH domain
VGEQERAQAAALAAVIAERARGRRGLGAELSRRTGRSRSTVGYWLKGTHPVPPDALGAVADALDTTPEELLDTARAAAAATAHEFSASGLSGTLPAAFPSPNTAGVWWYDAYPLWGRDDPRGRGTAGPDSGGGSVVMREQNGARGEPADVFVVLVQDDGLAEIETTIGRVRAGFRLFVDTRLAAAARPGAIVAGMSATGRLTVGALEQHPGDTWSLFTGVHREGIARADVLGEVVEYQSPPAPIGHIRGAGGAAETFFVASDPEGVAAKAH